VDRVASALNDHSKPLKGSRIHMAGVAYKRDIDDVRESPALDIIHLLERRGSIVTYSDPFVATLKHEGKNLESQDLLTSAAAADCVVVVTDHTSFDYPALIEQSKLIFDSRNALKKYKSPKIVRL
jgi:UDP-N-acetyl-D-glucosamine dehydrogenase